MNDKKRKISQTGNVFQLVGFILLVIVIFVQVATLSYRAALAGSILKTTLGIQLIPFYLWLFSISLIIIGMILKFKEVKELIKKNTLKFLNWFILTIVSVFILQLIILWRHLYETIIILSLLSIYLIYLQIKRIENKK